jgi:hypothetical protein
MDQLLDGWRQLVQRLENHQMIGSSARCPIRASVREPKDLNVPVVGIADLPRGAVIDLRRVADNPDSIGLRSAARLGLRDR